VSKENDIPPPTDHSLDRSALLGSACVAILSFSSGHHKPDLMPIVKIAPLITMAPALERKNRAHPLNAKMKREKRCMPLGASLTKPYFSF
jgi:hypothetical protein